MDFKQELRRVRREIQPVILAGFDIAGELGGELKSRVAERLDRRDRPKIVYICSRGCYGEEEIRESIEASRKAFRAGMIPACPHVMFPTDADNPIVNCEAEDEVSAHGRLRHFPHLRRPLDGRDVAGNPPRCHARHGNPDGP